jgi:hypothetical protein
MPLAGLEPAAPPRERPQTNAIDRTTTGIRHILTFTFKNTNFFSTIAFVELAQLAQFRST